jgi:Protein of unknown function (DUF429)
LPPAREKWIAADRGVREQVEGLKGPAYTGRAMRTLGIDLSADPKLTAACLISWERGHGEVEALVVGADVKGGLKDEALLDLAKRADKVGIDAPFGYPEEFVLAVTGWAQRDAWPKVDKAKLRYRATDRFVEARIRRPLSVSSERIASTAWRCAQLLTALEERTGEAVDRAGCGRLVEVYPAAALAMWGLDPSATRAPRTRPLAGSCSASYRSSWSMCLRCRRPRARPVRGATMRSTQWSPRSSLAQRLWTTSQSRPRPTNNARSLLSRAGFTCRRRTRWLGWPASEARALQGRHHPAAVLLSSCE